MSSRFEHVVGTPTARERTDLFDDVGRACVDRVGRAEGGSEFAAPSGEIRREDLPGPCDACALDGVETDGTAADDERRGTRLDADRAHGGAHPCHHAAADEAGPVERDVARDDDGPRLRHDAVLRVRRHDGEVMHRRTRARQAGAAVEEHALRFVALVGFAEDRQIALAVEAVAAVRIPRADDMVARPDGRHVAAHRFDDTGALVTEHDGQRIREGARHHFEIGVAQAAGPEPHEDVVGAERAHLQGFDDERLVDVVQHSRVESHGFILSDGAATG
jgi:hypothetical protein